MAKMTFITLVLMISVAALPSYSAEKNKEPAIPSGYNKNSPSNVNAEPRMKELEKDPTFGPMSAQPGSSDPTKAKSEKKK